MKPSRLIGFGASPIALAVAVVCLTRTVKTDGLFQYLFGRSHYLVHCNTVTGTQLTDAWIHP